MVDYAKIFPDIQVDCTHQHLLVHRAHRSEREMYNKLGRFTIDSFREKLTINSRKVLASGYIDSSHPINSSPNILGCQDLDFYQKLGMAVPGEVCAEFGHT